MRVAHWAPQLDPLGSGPMLRGLLKYRGPAFAEQVVVVDGETPMAEDLRAAGSEVHIALELERAVSILADADLVNVHCPSASRGAHLLASLFRTGRPFLFTLYGTPLYRTDLPAHCICTSASVHQSAPSSIGASERIEMGIDLQEFEPPEERPSGGRLVVTRVGPPRRHAEQFWWAMADVLTRHREVEVRVVGGGGVARGRVQVSNGHAGLGRTLAESDVVVASPQAGEGSVTYGVMAAMAMGRPAVLADTVDLRGCAVAGETALVVADGDAAVLAEAVEALLHDERLRRRLGQAARARAVLEFDIRSRVRQHEAVYGAVLRDSRWRPAAATAAPPQRLARRLSRFIPGRPWKDQPGTRP